MTRELLRFLLLVLVVWNGKLLNQFSPLAFFLLAFGSVPFEIEQCCYRPQHSEPEQSIEQGCVVLREPANDGLAVNVSQVGDGKKTHSSASGKSVKELLTRIFQGAGRK